MTKEEAIGTLQHELAVWERECKSKHPTKDALIMAINALKEQQNALEEQQEEHKKITKLTNLLSDPLLVPNGNKELRPVKNTSRQDVYDTLLRCQFVLGIPNRWYPKKWRNNND